MKQFMVELLKPENYKFNEKGFQIEQLRFRDLMKENLLQQVNINKDKTRFWLLFSVDSYEIMHDVLKTLPNCSNFDRKINELI